MNDQFTHQLNQLADGIAEDGYSIVDGFLSQEEVKNIQELDGFKNGLLQFKKAGIGKSQEKQINEAIRGDYIQWIKPDSAEPPLQVYLSKMKELIAFVNQNLYLSLKDFEVHQTIYPVGTFYKRHLDQFKKEDHRKLSVICYLNSDWQESDGGLLRIYLGNETKDVLPLAGRLVCFRSDLLEHEVLPATRERLSITGWLLDQPHFI
ncbi:MAG: 2OG-Fe(II) oxygenase [Bacteroidetes bacterium]|nr:2OG-Fe(II) oxygenase [Bacteroidota bacterium]